VILHRPYPANVVTDETNAEAAPGAALKEWAVVVHALLAGEQIVDLRKGGIREDQRDTGDGRSLRRFGVDSDRCYLYPTAEHQRPELLKPAYRHWIDLAVASPVGESIVLPGWAEVVDVATVTEPDQVTALAGKTIWSADYAAERLKWKQRDPLWVLVLRAHRFAEPVVVDWRDEYGGCTSWVALAGLPADPAEIPSEPALSDVAFEARRKGLS
jgi:hypothetical protein